MSVWKSLSTAAAALTLSFGLLAVGAQAVVAVPPPPIPAGAPSGPPPIAVFPEASSIPPPADQIGDPVTPAASCRNWHKQSNYGDRWPAGSSWWEYQCSSESDSSYDNCGGGGACNASCDYCYVETERRTDYFYWNGSDAVFYGEDYYYSLYFWGNLFGEGSSEVLAWWDAPSAVWYTVPPQSTNPPPNVPPVASFTAASSGLTCSFDPNSSSDSDGAITHFDWDFGDNSSTGGNNTNPQDNVAHHTYTAPGTYTATLTVRDDGSATDTTTKAVTVEGTPPPPDAPPTARFDVTCSALTCSFDGSPSSDSDGTIGAYSWNFGDGSGVGGDSMRTAQHTYFQPGTYTAGLTVTDNGGAANTVWHTISVKANIAPTAVFTITCVGVDCSFDGGPSADPDGSIAHYAWDFGDGTGGSGKTTAHTYAPGGSYTATLTVTDNAGATAAVSKAVTLIGLSARGFKQHSLQKVDLSWSGPADATFSVYRNGAQVATSQATTFTDTVGYRGSATYTYRVCVPAASTCSNDARVSF